MQSQKKPYVLYVAELIYSEISQIKRNNLDISNNDACLLYTSPSPRDGLLSRMPSSA